MGDKEDLLKQDIEGESETIHDIGKGIAASVIATVVVAVLILLKNSLGAVPQFDPIGMLATISGSTSRGVGWGIFFGGGVIVLGVMFALLDAHVEATTGLGELVRGVIFGVLAWLVFMLVFMPVYGAGAFGLSLGVGTPLLTFAAAVIYGLFLGGVYGALHPETVMA